MVTWQSNSQDGGNWDVYGQRYDAAGVAQGDEFLVNSTTSNQQQQASVTALYDGGFLVI